MFLMLDLDYAAFIRTAPGNSWANEVERIMASLNLALQGVALSRDSLDDPKLEQLCASANSMAKLRDIAKKNPDFDVGYRKALESVIHQLEERFRRVSYTGRHVKIARAASDDEIAQLFEWIRVIDPTLTRDETTRKDVEKHPALKKNI